MSMKHQADHAIKYWPLYGAVIGVIAGGAVAQSDIQNLKQAVIAQQEIKEDVIILQTQFKAMQAQQAKDTQTILQAIQSQN